MGTADKVCAAALAVHDQAARLGCQIAETSFILLELGGAFSAALAVDRGRIVDGMGGTSGPIGVAAPGALDGEVAFLAGTITKHLLFSGGASAVAGDPHASPDALVARQTPRARVAWAAFIEGAAKAVAALLVSAPRAREVVLSGRMAQPTSVREALAVALAPLTGIPLHLLRGFAPVSKQAAQGAALIADGLAGGDAAALVGAMELEGASGTVLDHLTVIAPSAARHRIGIGDA